jgi:hypothetical protein
MLIGSPTNIVTTWGLSRGRHLIVMFIGAPTTMVDGPYVHRWPDTDEHKPITFVGKHR